MKLQFCDKFVVVMYARPCSLRAQGTVHYCSIVKRGPGQAAIEGCETGLSRFSSRRPWLNVACSYCSAADGLKESQVGVPGLVLPTTLSSMYQYW